MENSTNPMTSDFSVSSIFEHATKAVYGAQTEIMIFLLAFGIHALFFGKLKIKSKPAPRMDKKVSIGRAQAGIPEQARQQQQPARCMHAKELARVAVRFCELDDQAEVATELRAKMRGVPVDNALDALAGLLDGAGKAATPQLLAAVRAQMREQGLQPNVDLGELLLRNLFGLRLLDEFNDVYQELTAMHGAVPSLSIIALKASLRGGELTASLERMECLALLWNKNSDAQTPSTGPVAVLHQLVRLAAQEQALPRLLKRLIDLDLMSCTIDIVLVECVQHGEPADVQTVLECSKTNRLQFGEAAYGALIKNTRNSQEALSLFNEAVSKLKTPPKEILAVAGEWAIANDDNALADAMLKKLPSKNPPGEAVGKILRFYGRIDRAIALNMYKEKFKGVDLSADVAAMHLVAQASFLDEKGGRAALEGLLVATTEAARVALLKSFVHEKELQAALLVLWASPDKGACLYNTAIDACVECRSIDDAQQVMAAAVKAGVADVVTYNTIIKAYSHPQVRRHREARQAMEDMKAAGLKPNGVTFNEMLDAMVKSCIEDAWPVLNEMRAAGIRPNRISCAILLKAVQARTKAADVERAIALLDELDEDLDEVLLCSVVDACIRAARAELLIPQLTRYRAGGKVLVKNAHTYGSIIRAYSFVHDVNGVWETWREMRTRRMAPNAVALGCMTEALVHNGEPEAAFELINEVSKEEQWAPLLNAVIYCSVLKGFSHQKRFDRMWTVYKQMLTLNLKFSIVTFNTLLDSCSRNGETSRIPALLKDMETQGIEANIITYSIIVKGYCQENRIDEAFSVCEGMVQTTSFRPDEIMWNTLLDGCARQGMYERGVTVLEEMEKAGVIPTNFTLSVLVKLASRSRMLDRGFEFCEELSTKYRFRLNVHVYANLINACITNKDMDRAFHTMERMLSDRVKPDTRVYTLLLKACVSAGQGIEAAGLLRAAVALGNVHPRLAKYEARQLQPQGGLPSALITEILEGIAGQCRNEHLAVSLIKDLRTVPNIKLDPKLQFRLATFAINR